MAVYKVSYVVKSSNHPGGIINFSEEPRPGDTFQVGDLKLVILEVIELMPPRGEFYYIHATCQRADEK
jgi:hypothetical protein